MNIHPITKDIIFEILPEMVESGDDMINSYEFVKVVDFRNNKLNKLGL